MPKKFKNKMLEDFAFDSLNSTNLDELKNTVYQLITWLDTNVKI